MKINLQTTINGALQSVEAEIKGVNVYIETAFGRSVIQLGDKSELAAIEPYADVIQGMADAYAALKNPQSDDDVSGEASESDADGEESGAGQTGGAESGEVKSVGADENGALSNACSEEE